jgi:hypothetical protein
MSVSFDDSAFLAGLHQALEDFKVIGEQHIEAVAEEILETAQSDVHVLSGETKASLGAQRGIDPVEGPYVEVGVTNRAALGSDPNKAVFEEFGTRTTAPVAFMRRAIARVISRSW